MPSSITRNSLASNAKRIFEILWGILEGRTIRAWPSQPFLKNCQNGTFWSVHGIWNFFGPNDFIWSAWKVPFYDFIQNVSQAPSMCISMWIKVNKWNYLINPSQESKNSFCFRFLQIFRKTGKEIRESLFFYVKIFKNNSVGDFGVFFLIATALVANHFSLLVAWALAHDWLLGRGSRLHKWKFSIHGRRGEGWHHHTICVAIF